MRHFLAFSSRGLAMGLTDLDTDLVILVTSKILTSLRDNPVTFH